MFSTPSPEKRDHVRYRMKDTLLAAVQGNYCDSLACIVDLNRNGISFCSICKESELTGKRVFLDLITDGNRIIMRSVAARLVYTAPERLPGGGRHERLKRYGLQFVNLSDLEQRLIDLIIKNYALAE